MYMYTYVIVSVHHKRFHEMEAYHTAYIYMHIGTCVHIGACVHMIEIDS